MTFRTRKARFSPRGRFASVPGCQYSTFRVWLRLRQLPARGQTRQARSEKYTSHPPRWCGLWPMERWPSGQIHCRRRWSYVNPCLGNLCLCVRWGMYGRMPCRTRSCLRPLASYALSATSRRGRKPWARACFTSAGAPSRSLAFPAVTVAASTKPVSSVARCILYPKKGFFRRWCPQRASGSA